MRPLRGPLDVTPRSRSLAVDGTLAVVATYGYGLSAIDVTDGRPLGEARVAGWRAHAFMGARLVVEARDGFSVLRLDTGEVVGVWPSAEG